MHSVDGALGREIWRIWAEYGAYLTYACGNSRQWKSEPSNVIDEYVCGYGRTSCWGSFPRGRVLGGADSLIKATRADFLLFHEIELELANLFLAQFVCRLSKVLTELVDMKRIRVDGVRREVSQSHVVGHALDKWVHSFFVGCHTWLAW